MSPGPEGEASLRALEEQYGPLPTTAGVRTPRGRHIYFRHEGDSIPNSTSKLGPGLDIRGDGGYAVGPWSTHPSGVKYQWENNLAPYKASIADLPDWLLHLISRGSPEAPPVLPESIPAERLAGAKAYAAAALKGELDRLRKTAKGQRNKTLNDCAFRLGQLVVWDLLDPHSVTEQLSKVAQQIGLEADEIGPTIRSGLGEGQRSPRQLPFLAAPSGPNDPLTQELAQLGETDTDNAERFARRCEHQVICTPGRGWLAFDGKRWQRDELRHVVQLAQNTARLIAAEARYRKRSVQRIARTKFAKSSLSKGGLDRMLDLAKGRLMVKDEVFDANPWLLNTETGTIDLRTGQLKAHDPRNFITKIVPVTYDPKAQCPTFKRFLTQALDGDRDLMEYVQKDVGYTLTGVTTEQVFFFLHGITNTSKSTIANLIRQMLGDYGVHTPTETLLSKQYDNAIPADLARLAGARMVTAIEANWNQQIDEARIKAITGGDPITARFLHQNFFEFLPEFQLWFVANDFPRVRGTDGAFWERVRVIPFRVHIPPEKRDPKLPEKLRAEWPGILAWAVRGCLKWQRESYRRLLVTGGVRRQRLEFLG